MRISIFATGLALITAVPSEAGPWPREAGSVFLSFAVEGRMDRRNPVAPAVYNVHAYGEAGLGRKLTLGADLYAGDDTGTATLFLRRTVTPPEARHQIAFSLGVGQRRDAAGTDTLARLGASWGIGFETRWGSGWATVEAQYRSGSSGDAEMKLDGTFGLRPAEGWMAIGQLQAARFADADPTLRLQATVVRRLGERLSLEGGVVHGLVNDDRTGLRLGLWSEF